jgi:hypothetical protein
MVVRGQRWEDILLVWQAQVSFVECSRDVCLS